MREIKFRAWNKQNKCFFQVTEMNFRSNGSLYSVSPNQGEDWYLVGEDVEVMQFTRIMDKNGVEIYEGDIVKGRYADEYYVYSIENERVVFKNGCFGLLDNNDFFTTFDYYLEKQSKFEIEVIGNIYEHSHLLKDKR